MCSSARSSKATCRPNLHTRAARDFKHNALTGDPSTKAHEGKHSKHIKSCRHGISNMNKLVVTCTYLVDAGACETGRYQSPSVLHGNVCWKGMSWHCTQGVRCSHQLRSPHLFSQQRTCEGGIVCIDAAHTRTLCISAVGAAVGAHARFDSQPFTTSAHSLSHASCGRWPKYWTVDITVVLFPILRSLGPSTTLRLVKWPSDPKTVSRYGL